MDEKAGFILSNGETNVIPFKKWAFGKHQTRFVRINEKPFPYCYLWESDCPGHDDHCCDWWREKYHRDIAWAMTSISKNLVIAEKRIVSVGSYNKVYGVSLQQYTSLYIVPLCKEIAEFNTFISLMRVRRQFAPLYKSENCGPHGRCADGYYSILYWEGLEMLACATLQDVLSKLENHMTDLNIKTQKNKTGEQLYNALSGLKQKTDINIGGHSEWLPDFEKRGGQIEFVPEKKDPAFEGFVDPETGKTAEEKSALDKLIEQELGKKDEKAGIDQNMILLGAGALALVLIATKTKKGQ